MYKWNVLVSFDEVDWLISYLYVGKWFDVDYGIYLYMDIMLGVYLLFDIVVSYYVN